MDLKAKGTSTNNVGWLCATSSDHASQSQLLSGNQPYRNSVDKLPPSRTLKLCFTGNSECAINLVTMGICGQNMNSYDMQTVIAQFNSLPIPCSFEEETLLTLVEDLQVYLFRQDIDLCATTKTSTYCSAANRFIPSSKIPVTLSFK